MKGGGNMPDPPEDPGNVDEHELATNQQTVVVPWFVGEAKFALHWVSDAYNQFTRPAPQQRPGKK